MISAKLRSLLPGLVRRRRRVLLVEDDLLERRALRAWLSLFRFDTIEASAEREALTLVREGGHFDLAIVDHRLFASRGERLAGRLVEEFGMSPTRIVILTAYADDLHDSPARRLGVRIFSKTDDSEAFEKYIEATFGTDNG